MYYNKGVTQFFVGFFVFIGYTLLQQGFHVNGDTSVCTKHESYTNSRYVSYIETYHVKRWGLFRKIATRKNYRWEYYRDVRKVVECCHGYKPGTSTSGCDPICLSGCHNGECYQPNVCKCFAGYITSLNTQNGYLECVPSCPGGCDGGVCAAPDTCICRDGYQLNNDRNTCEPVCFPMGAGGPRGCGHNALCIAPNTCECHSGYVKDPKSLQILCLPVCIPACGLNAYCHSPNHCQCNDGNIADTNQYPAVGSPSITSYTNMTTETVFATAGFNGSVINCKPLCTPECPINSTCLAPDFCQCNDGYHSESVSNEKIHLLQCVPTCQPTCINAQCVSPNKCICHSGFEADSVDDFVCVPTCQNECVNASCIRPDYCECYEGYVKEDGNHGHNDNILSNVCAPNCQGGCQHGQCVAPAQCVCDDGYILVGMETTPGDPATMENGTKTSEITSYSGADITITDAHTNTENTNYDDIESTSSYRTVGNGDYSTDSTIASRSVITVVPIYQQFCQPLCKLGCPSGSVCIAPDQCQSQSGSHDDSNDFPTNVPIIKDESNCDGNVTNVGNSCNTVNAAILNPTTGSAIGTIILVVIILGVSLAVYWAHRKKRTAHGDGKSTVALTDQSEASDPLFNADEISYL